MQGSIGLNSVTRATTIRIGSVAEDNLLSTPLGFILHIARILERNSTVQFRPVGRSTWVFPECNPSAFDELPPIVLSLNSAADGLVGVVVLYPADYIAYDARWGCTLRLVESVDDREIQFNPIKFMNINIMIQPDSVHLCDSAFVYNSAH